MKLCQGKFRLDVRKRFLAETVVGRRNRLPRAAVTAPACQSLASVWTLFGRGVSFG